MTERLPMEINVRESGAVSILEVHGRLTIGEPSEQLYAALQSVVKKGIRKVVVSLNSTPQIDSSGLSTLVRISIQLARDGGVLRLVCGPGATRHRRARVGWRCERAWKGRSCQFAGCCSGRRPLCECPSSRPTARRRRAAHWVRRW